MTAASRYDAAVETVVGVAAAHAQATDSAAAFPTDALAAMRSTQLLGLLVPATDGGPGGTLTDLVDVTEALGRVDMSVAMIFAMHCQQVAAIAAYGAEKLRAEVLPAVARGELYLGSVTTEPGKGGHLLTSESGLERAGEMLRVDRQAPIVTGGPHADAFLITTRAPEAGSATQVDLVYAARDQLEIEVTGGWQPLGMRATHSVPMRLRGAVPQWQVIGEHGGFRDIATAVFAPLAHIGWAAAWLGAAAGAYSRVLRHARSEAGRRQFAPSSELVLLRLAEIRIRLDAAHALLRHTVSVVESASDMSASPVQLLLNTLKIRAAEESFAAVHELVELVGLRHGYLTDSPLLVERTFRDLRSASLNYGNDRLRLANGALTLRDPGVRLA
ncbi:acyl-CoA dehydrogenase [Micromonospora phaseoli]|uniref:Acyl-CoA dehydrogenase n=1 Tax=Micromonospora phaseoli TaxID=1144548 RepID=A0A1H7DYY9_9ACTN|nr:acyl-CoA dehydrogenase family protein [Micromonospora phaseoli]PZV99199.1 acyl-CoA dehydrogenase [Micromonospora phaseoli]GIJ80005.1 acyl-CoA dehydrogenase [Micromonospora phaseoli]SEK04892.1 acyl-CoA dehydrogenase [Micromonospora phaseoli]